MKSPICQCFLFLKKKKGNMSNTKYMSVLWEKKAGQSL